MAEHNLNLANTSTSAVSTKIASVILPCLLLKSDRKSHILISPGDSLSGFLQDNEVPKMLSHRQPKSRISRWVRDLRSVSLSFEQPSILRLYQIHLLRHTNPVMRLPKTSRVGRITKIATSSQYLQQLFGNNWSHCWDGIWVCNNYSNKRCNPGRETSYIQEVGIRHSTDVCSGR